MTETVHQKEFEENEKEERQEQWDNNCEFCGNDSLRIFPTFC